MNLMQDTEQYAVSDKSLFENNLALFWFLQAKMVNPASIC